MMPTQELRRQSTRQRLDRPICSPLLQLMVVFGLVLQSTMAGVFGRRSASAAIFGNLLGNRNGAAESQSSSQTMPPPPPPPHLIGGDQTTSSSLDNTSDNTHQQHNPMTYHSTSPADSDGYLPPPPPPFLDHDGANHACYNSQQHQQRDDVHVRQLDVLTERIMELEAMAANDRNIILEWQQNCTSLMSQVSSLQDNMQEEVTKCQALEEQYTKAVSDQDKLKEELKAATREAEDLAALIEKHRLSVEDEEESFRKKKTKRRRGLLAWLFGWNGDTDDTLDGAYGEARSTLLKALQTERNSVDELESAVASLQQNNSAIAEQVQSRDAIIDELNDRIAIFEEDKIVLKAALKQLQKEMKEEAPKTRKLAEDYKAAQKETQRLQKEIEMLIQAHQRELKKLQKQITQEEDKLRLAEGNLTEIGSYVDKLESRLADFAMARREIEQREAKCKELEDTSDSIMEEKEKLQAKLADYEIEREEHKQLLQELAAERTSLTVKSQTDRSELELNAMRHLGSIAKLENDNKSLNKVNCELQSRIHELELQEKKSKEAFQLTQNRLISTEEQLAVLQSIFDERSLDRDELSIKLEDSKREKEDLLQQLERLTQAAETDSTTIDERNKELQTSLHATIAEVQVKSDLLKAVEHELLEMKEKLESAEQEKQRLEASLRDRMLSQIDVKKAASPPGVGNMFDAVVDVLSLCLALSLITVFFPQADLSKQELELVEFESETPIHLSLTTLSPDIYGKACRPQPFTDALIANASATVVLPFEGSFNYSRIRPKASMPRPLTQQSSHLPRRYGIRSPAKMEVQQGHDARTIHRSKQSPSTPFDANMTLASQNDVLAIRGRNATRNATAHARKVPFREIRKFFAKSTGIHGLFTKSSTSRPARGGSRKPTFGPRKVAPGASVQARLPPGQATATSVSRPNDGIRRQLPQSKALGVNQKSFDAARQPVLPSSVSERQLPPPTASVSSARLELHPSSSAATEIKDPAQSSRAADSKRSFGGGLMQPPSGKESDSLPTTISDTVKDR
jgi:hypothetical protein